MYYEKFKTKLLSFFDEELLKSNPDEWGFFNETEERINIVGFATNITPDVVQKARQMKVDFLLTHHDSWEFVFGLKEKCNTLLKENNIVHAFFHAPLDDADFGTSASLASALCLSNCQKVIPYQEQFLAGRIGEIEQSEPFEKFSSRLAVVLQEPVRQFKNNDKPVKKICVVAGGGNMTGDMKIAVDNGCDTYITGEYVLYSQQYAQLTNMNLLVGSHTNTEILGVQSLGQRLVIDTDLELVRIPEANF